MAEICWSETLDGINLPIFIVDAEHYEIFYTNEALRRFMGKENGGEPCYAYFCGRSEPCEACPGKWRLLENEGKTKLTVDFRNMQTLSVRQYLVRWPGRREARLCVIDAPDNKDRDAGPDLLSALVRIFNGAADELSAIDSALSALRDFMNADYACIYEYAEDRTAVCTHEIADSSEHWLERAISRDDARQLLAALGEADSRLYRFARNMPKEVPFPVKAGQAVYCAALRVHGEILGFLCIRMRETAWNDAQTLPGLIAAGNIANAIVRRKSRQSLEAALKLAREAGQAKTQFLSNMSHEMRTPMNAIIGMLQIAKDSRDIEKIKACMASIEIASKHMMHTINDVLDISELESDKFSLNSAPLNCKKLLSDVCLMHMAQARAKHQHIRLTLGSGLKSYYYGDESRILQMLNNLLSNAVKFTPAGGDIHVFADAAADDEGALMIRVSDTGIGIGEAQLPHIFDAFEQADNTVSRRYEGTGLGLTISRQLARRMGGDVFVQSQKGVGSMFTVTLRLPRAEWREHERALSIRELAEYCRMLLVSGDADTIRAFSELLPRCGINIELAHDPESGRKQIELAAQSGAAFDFMFLDAAAVRDASAQACSELMQGIDPNHIAVITELGVWDEVNPMIPQAALRNKICKPVYASLVFDALMNAWAQDPQRCQRCRKSQPAKVDFSDLNLLLADDIEINRMIFAAMLQDTGIHIDMAKNGREAVNLFLENPEKYDIIVLDVHMPEMNGLEAVRAIRASEHPRARSIPVLAVTANAFWEDVENCLDAGMDDHIMKPIDEQIILDKIRFYTEGRT